jgi:apolipoprotein D and lipocalin family protein
MIGDSAYRQLLSRLEAQGYDTARFERVPQDPSQLGRPGFQSP